MIWFYVSVSVMPRRLILMLKARNVADYDIIRDRRRGSVPGLPGGRGREVPLAGAEPADPRPQPDHPLLWHRTSSTETNETIM